VILTQVAVHHTDEPTFEGVQRHGASVAGGEPLLEVRPPRAVQPNLDDGDAMNSRIKLSVTVFRSTQSPRGASRPLRNRSQPGMLGESGFTGKPGHQRGLTHDLRRAQRSTALHAEKTRCHLAHSVGDALL
jgi:hypothetical protein